MHTHAQEVHSGERFEFGKNWSRFLSVLDEDRIAEAERSLRRMLECDSLEGQSFLDIGSGSGLFSLAARRLGARVLSLDYDPQSVGCTAELRRRFFPDDPDWTIREGSVLDEDMIASLGQFDVVYSWGVLHHTGNLQLALEYSAERVRRGGRYFIALYNDQGGQSRLWRHVKKLYCRGGVSRVVVVAVFFPLFVAAGLVLDLVNLTVPWKRYTGYKRSSRGMSVMYDWIDWLGGYPFEVAKPEEILEFGRARGMRLIKLRTVNGLGNNEFVFVKESD